MRAKAPPDAVVFAQGEYTCNVANGTACVRVPRSITLGEIAPTLARLMKGGTRARTEMRSTPAATTGSA